MIYEVRPFELLRLIRDGVVTSRSDLHRKIPLSVLHHNVSLILDQMAKLGWINKTSRDAITPLQRILEVQNALGISLRQLSPYDKGSVVANPLFGPNKAPSTSIDIFVLMPFQDELRAVYDDHIHAVANRLRITCARADDFFSADSVMADVWNAILHARVLVADCTGRNPNVFYEMGIAHTIGKPVILIAQNKEDIPFDVQQFRTIIYHFTPRGMRELETALEATIKRELAEPRTIEDILNMESLRRRFFRPSAP